ncbi:hypothetical protein BIU88_04080 [Chlorobaculum limnaeum]|uniref:DUF4347 domain-containing protein n=1 Tax=Chlorobaculum limnaeum TaxID=274537 RepID=A0A1D8CWV6_CHLLM|nr:FG-GAP-like repeat-containing protein [Chlorobaculum limnaeum]AOS83392.1 hypothetical protein BIU88_04080 [Chlorobaculum limnaeum]
MVSIVFIDSRVEQKERLIAAFSDDTEYHVLSEERDGIDQIADTLSGKSGYSSIHIISHGSPGSITIGSTLLDDANLDHYADALSQIGYAFQTNADLLLYGCNVGAGDAGQAFIEHLSQLTSLDVAASNDATGGTLAGGDWELEVQAGAVEEAPVVVSESYQVLLGNQDPKISVTATISFSAKVDYATGAKPVFLTSIDIDGDSDVDVIVANQDGDTVSVLKNNGNGTFAAKVNYVTGDRPYSVTSADVDGDGDSDLLVANSNIDTVSVLKNSGNGTFAAKVNYVTGDAPQSVTSADVDGDGDADLLVANWGSNTVSVLKNKGNGTFVTKVDYATGVHPVSVTSADVDGDGDADLIVANRDNDTVSVLKNKGNGTFSAKVDYATGDYPTSVTSADVNRDGDCDLIVANGISDTISVLKNNGNGTFAAKVGYETGDLPRSVTSADVDGDGDADLLVANYNSDTVSVLKNNGNGTFSAKVDYATGDGPVSVTSADVDGDGDADMLVPNWYSDTVSVLLNTSMPAKTVALEQTAVPVSSGVLISDPDGDASWHGGSLQVQIWMSAEAGDTLSLPGENPGDGAIWFNAGALELMAGDVQIGTGDAASVSNNALWTLTFNSNATNALVQEVARSMQFTNSSDDPGTDDRTIQFTVTDNEGGTAHVDQEVRVEAVNDAPTLTGFISEAVVSADEDTMVEISFADLLAKGDEADVDGAVEGFVVKGVTSGTLKIGISAESAQAWSFSANNTIDAAHHAYWLSGSNSYGNIEAFSVVAVDDGGAESLTAIDVGVEVNPVSDLPEISIPALLSFAAKVDYATGWSPSSVTSADIDGDGDADVIVANSDSDTVSVLKNNGNGTFAAKVDYATGDDPTSVIGTDIDSDGDADVIVANFYSDTVSVLLNNGNGTFAAKVDYTTGDAPLRLISADVDGDGYADMIVVNEGSGTVSVLKNNRNGTFAAKVDYTTGDLPVSVTSADVDGDGMPTCLCQTMGATRYRC